MKRRTRSQRQRARRRLLTLGLLLALAVALLPTLFVLTPTQAIRIGERYVGLPATQVIAKERLGPATFYLSANENALLVTPYRLSFHQTPHLDGTLPVGWASWSESSAADLTRMEGPIYVAGFHAYDSTQTWTHLYGRADLPEAVAVVGQDLSGAQTEVTDLIQGPDGHRYFWFLVEQPKFAPEESAGILPVSLTFLDQRGEVVAHYDAGELFWSSLYI